MLMLDVLAAGDESLKWIMMALIRHAQISLNGMITSVSDESRAPC